MAEAEQPEGIGLVLGGADAVLGLQAARVDPLEHFDHLDVRPAVQRSPQAQTPAAHEANRFARAEPTSRTVEVLQFCSWSA